MCHFFIPLCPREERGRGYVLPHFSHLICNFNFHLNIDFMLYPPHQQTHIDEQIPDNSRFLVGQYVTIHDDVISHVNITNVKEEDGGKYTKNIFAPSYTILVPLDAIRFAYLIMILSHTAQGHINARLKTSSEGRYTFIGIIMFLIMTHDDNSISIQLAIEKRRNVLMSEPF